MIISRGSLVSSLALAMTLALFACGPSARRPGEGGGGGGGGGTTDAPFTCSAGATENAADTCSDGKDNDCDGLVDCSDPDCSGIGQCPVCGMVQHPLSQPLALPDGVCGTNDDGNCSCTTDADCASLQPAGQHCFDILDGMGSKECRPSYTSTLHFDGFPQGSTFTAASNIQSVCITMEHSWVRDLEITLRAPDGKEVQLQKFLGRNPVTEFYLGMAYDCDDTPPLVPGTGAMYCWSPTATKPTILDYANNGGMMDSVANCDMGTSEEIPPDTYSAATPWTDLVGAPLNGDWQIEVTDLWQIDNGYIFQWQLSFDPSLVQTCSTPPIQ
jgi:hypothetical protein